MRFVYGFASALLALGFVLASPSTIVSSPGGAPVPFNGGPNTSGGTNPTCTACHGSFPLDSGTGSVTIAAPAAFMPGETISLLVTVDNTTDPFPGGDGNQQGFLLSAQLDDGTHVGEFVVVDADATQIVGNGDYVTHRLEGIAQAVWSVEWTAPDEAPESVTFYVAGNAGNGGEGPGGDYIYTSDLTVPRATTSNEETTSPLVARVDAIYPNPFVSSAHIDFTLGEAAPVTITLFDGLGRTVRVVEEGTRGPGAHTVRVEADGLPAGVYFVEVRTPTARTTRPFTLTR